MDPIERKKHILLCAKKLFSKNGYYKTQISDIIDEAGIARGTIYQYFQNKNDIFKTLLEDFYQQWEKAVQLNPNEINLKTISPGEYFLHRVKKTLHFFAKDHDLCHIFLRMGLGLRDEFESIINRLEEKSINTVANDLKLGIKAKAVVKNLDVALASELITGAVLRVAYHYFGNGAKKKKISDRDIDKMAIQIEKIISNGIFKPKKII